MTAHSSARTDMQNKTVCAANGRFFYSIIKRIALSKQKRGVGVGRNVLRKLREIDFESAVRFEISLSFLHSRHLDLFIKILFFGIMIN